MQILYLFFTAGALICASRVAQSKNPVYAVMCLVLLFANTSGLLLLQGIEFFAILQIIIYIGALSVMFLFVVMLLNIKLTEIVSYQRATYFTMAQSFLLWAVSLGLLLPSPLGVDYGTSSAELPVTLLTHDNMLRELGVKLYIEYADLLIMASLLLLVAMIGAVVLALKKQPKYMPQHHRDLRLLVQTIET